MPSEPIPSLADDPPPSARTLLGRGALALLGAVLAGGIVLLLVLASQHEPRPRDVKLTLVGSAPDVAKVRALLPGGHDAVRTSATFTPARKDLRERDVSAVLVVRPSGSEKLYVASAASEPVARLVRADASAVARAAGARLTVSDVAALPRGDGAGAASSGLVLALAIAGLLGAAALAAAASEAPVLGQVLLLALFCLAAGALGAVIADQVLDALTGHLVRVGLVGALATAAVAFGTLGLQTALGRTGAVLSGLALVALSVTSSGGSGIPQLVPEPLRAIGGSLPAANATDAVRGVTYFANAGIDPSLLILGSYAAGGLLLALVAGALRSRRVGRLA